MKLIKNEITLFRQGKCLQAGGSISQQSQQLMTKWEAYHVLEQEMSIMTIPRHDWKHAMQYMQNVKGKVRDRM